MNDGLVHVYGATRASPALLAFACAPLVVKTLTIRCKVKPEANAWLEQAAREVNQVWNFANATSYQALNSYTTRSLPPITPEQVEKNRKTKELKKANKAKKDKSSGKTETGKPVKEKTAEQRKWLSTFDLNSLIVGCGEVFGKIGSEVAQKVNAEYVNKRNAAGKSKLRFRASKGSKKSLGWVPFKASNIRQKGNSITFMGKRIRLFNQEYYFSHRKSAIKLCEGNFAQNALGEWFFNQVMEVAFASLVPLCPGSKLGLDPGKDISLSSGEKLLYSFYRDAEEKLATLQRRAHKKQAKFLHNDIKNRRLNQQHQDSTRLVREHGEIYIGDNSVARMKCKTKCLKMGKSISDNAIGQFKTLLNYKGHWAGRKVVLVSERYTTQDCSNCGLRNGPRGLRQLVVRKWQCQDCNTWHDRDINSAVNMLTAEVSSKNATFQPRNGLPFAGTR